MTDLARRSLDCLDAEVLASLIDGQADAATRARAEAHIADCSDCYEAFVEAAAISSESDDAAAVIARSVQIAAPAPRRIPWLAFGVAAAAVLFVAIGLRVWLTGPSALELRTTLLQSAGATRVTEARWADWSAHADPPATLRGGTSPAVPPEVLTAASRARAALPSPETSEEWRTVALADLLIGDVDRAVVNFERATSLNDNDTAAKIDLSAARLEQFRRSGDTAQARRALDDADAALRLSPQSLEALFNRALAKEAVDGRDAARSDWEKYLSTDGSSPWAQEARNHLR